MRLSCDCSFSDSAPQTLWGPIYLSWLHVFVDPPREQTEIRRFFHRLYRFLFRAAHFACARTLFNGGFGETLLRAEEEHGHRRELQGLSAARCGFLSHLVHSGARRCNMTVWPLL